MNVTVIISAELSTQTANQNKGMTELLRKTLQDMRFEFIECDGVYMGTKEKSFAVPTDSIHVNTLLELADDFAQECILVVEQETKKAYFVDCEDHEWQKAGLYCKTTRKDAMNQDGHTYFPAANAYYTIK